MVRCATNLQRERRRIRHLSGWLVTTGDHNRVTLFPGCVLPVTIMSINVVGDVAGCAEPAARTLIGPSCRTALKTARVMRTCGTLNGLATRHQRRATLGHIGGLARSRRQNGWGLFAARSFSQRQVSCQPAPWTLSAALQDAR
jgi:hypothetical protein